MEEQTLISAEEIFKDSFNHDAKTTLEWLRQYNLEKPLEDFLVVEHFHLLPSFLRKKGGHPKLNSTMSFEITEALLSVRDFGPWATSAYPKLNPTVHIIDNREGFIGALAEKKLFLIYVHPETLEVCYKSLTQEDANLMDWVAHVQDEEEPEKVISSAPVRKSLDELVSVGLIIRSL